MEAPNEKLHLIIRGYYSKRFLTRVLLPLITAFFITFYGIAWVMYPHYDPITMDISALGDASGITSGWIFWGLAMILVGLCELPMVPYIYRIFASYGNKLNKISAVLMTLSAIGSIGLGVFPQFPGWDPIHQSFAGVALGGLYFSNLLWGIILQFRFANVAKIKKFFHFLFGWGAPIGFVITTSIKFGTGGDLRTCSWGICPWYLQFSFWEWMLFLCIFIDFFTLLLILPESNQKTAE
jgi:hypothetical membrane protein